MKTNKRKILSSTEQNSGECRNNGLKTASYLSLFLSIILIACQQAQPTGAILNCFTPNMFKTGKAGQSAPAFNGGDRINWYPQSVYQGGYSGQHLGYAGQHNPMKYLFQPKWKTGSSFFGGSNKLGWNNWRMGGNLRPGFGGGYGGGAPVITGPTVGYPFSEQLNLPAFPTQPNVVGNSYNNPSNQLNDGWSAPVTYLNQQLVAPIQQSQIGGYDGVYSNNNNNNNNKLQQSSAALLQPAKQQVDLYGGTKGGSGTKKPKY